ncbi:hypothetical protein AG1IA_02879 [Rhizoctonia solani AG-1 IA]|uniref:Uncharacterized protein n=1 Tax=Thanatephorus cucumeris (strain AG1-IA) TaxID=983506 RepID=L8WYC0_THACA|nr:hypothetical protein AG1IA_02879 [Rhizoctonia solani AG-1 IA]
MHLARLGLLLPGLLLLSQQYVHSLLTGLRHTRWSLSCLTLLVTTPRQVNPKLLRYG